MNSDGANTPPDPPGSQGDACCQDLDEQQNNHERQVRLIVQDIRDGFVADPHDLRP